MDILCRHKREHGRDYCATDCPSAAPSAVYDHVRVESPADLPAPEDRTIDVAVLDMNCGWENLGHDSLVHAVQDVACDTLPELQEAGLRVRTMSFDIRVHAQIPEPPGGRFSLYIGTGGPGHIDPTRNDGTAEGTQGLDEDASWQTPFHRLLEAITADEHAALIAVCHTYGVLSLWSGIARPVLRGPEKNGKSSGILDNVLTPEAQIHPWFGRFASELPDGRTLRILDNRLYDLIPTAESLPPGFLPIGYETLDDGSVGDALTMVEFARDPGGVMPRIFGSNHHPEILDRIRQRMILQTKRERGEVSREWYEERLAVLTRVQPDDRDDHRLHATSAYTLLGPIRFHLYRALRERASQLRLPWVLHEESVHAGVHAVP
jgi:hypothetical protein